MTVNTMFENQIPGTVIDIAVGPVNSYVGMELSGNINARARLDTFVLDELDLAVGAGVVAAFRAKDAMLAVDYSKSSIENALCGTVASLCYGAVNADVVVNLTNGYSVLVQIPTSAAKEFDLRNGSSVSVLVHASDIALGPNNGLCGVEEHVDCVETETGGARIVRVTASAASRLCVYVTYDNDVFRKMITHEVLKGTYTHRITLGYGFKVKVRIAHNGNAHPQCQIGLSTDYALNSGKGAVWIPRDIGCRPQQTPVCMMKWYISGSYSSVVLSLLESDFCNSAMNAVRVDPVEEAGEFIAAEIGCGVPVAMSVALAFKTILEVFELVRKAELINIFREHLSEDFVISVMDSGDGTTPALTSDYVVEGWNSKTLLGEPGYSGTFTDNSTYDVTDFHK